MASSESKMSKMSTSILMNPLRLSAAFCAVCVVAYFFIELAIQYPRLKHTQELEDKKYTKIYESGRRWNLSKKYLEAKSRENPILMTLDTPEFKKLLTPELVYLKQLFDKNQHELRIVGGAVRDVLLGQQPRDIDLSTTASPEQMKHMFRTDSNTTLIWSYREKHGTITVKVNNKDKYEVTTLGLGTDVDLATDWSKEFPIDWKTDAHRRDFTINAMYLGFDGSLYDYFYGYDDLLQRRVAFTGDAHQKIKFGCNAIVRYFRFYGKIALAPDNHDEDVLSVIRDHSAELGNVAGKRIWMNLKNTLLGKYAGDLLKTMLDIGLGSYLGLPPQPDISELSRVLSRGEHLGLHPVCYLAALLRDLGEVAQLHARLKFSALDRELAHFLVEHRETIVEDQHRPMKPYEKLVLYSSKDKHNATEFVRQLLKYKGEEKLLQRFDSWEVPHFPITDQQLQDNGVTIDSKYNSIHDKLKDIWFENEYKHTTEDLVKMIPHLKEEIDRETLRYTAKSLLFYEDTKQSIWVGYAAMMCSVTPKL